MLKKSNSSDVAVIVGFIMGSNRVKEIISQNKKNYKRIYVLGYSVGATIAWLCSGDDILVNGVIAFYGSRTNILEVEI